MTFLKTSRYLYLINFNFISNTEHENLRLRPFAFQVRNLPENDWLYQQLRAYRKEMDFLKCNLDKNREAIEEQISLSVEQQFSIRELEYSNLEGKKREFHELENAVFKKTLEREKIAKHTVLLQESVAKAEG